MNFELNAPQVLRRAAGKRLTLALMIAIGSASLHAAVAGGDADFALTIYSSAQPGGVAPEQLNDYQSVPGYALVSDTRTMAIVKGRSELRFSDVAQRIDPTTVSFTSLTDPLGTRVLEQNYQFDLVSQSKLLSRYIGGQIVVTQSSGQDRITHRGTLLGASDGLLMQTDNGGVLALNSYDSFAFASLPGGLITKPTLVWLLDAKQHGDHKARVAYQTKGVTWWSDYNVILNADTKQPKMNLSAWVTIVNQSGGTYHQAKIKLVAGHVNRAPATVQYAPQMRNTAMLESVAKSDEGFVESGLFEYHLYTLGRRSDVPNNSTKQLELFPAKINIPAKRKLVFTASGIGQNYFYGGANTDQGLATQAKGEVHAYLEFDNKEAAGLGIALPKGRVRVSQAGPDGNLEFIGEDVIDHTPKNETVNLKLGRAFDVVGERKQSQFSYDEKARTMTESFVISVRNRKSEAVQVSVREYLYRWSSWTITDASQKFDPQDAQTVDFPISVAADSETQVKYTVRYQW